MNWYKHREFRSGGMLRRLAILLVLGLLVAAAWWAVREHVSLATLIDQEQVLRGLIATHPVTAFACGFLLYVALSLVPGTSGKSIVFGWLFGFWAALVLVNLALTLAALIAFLAMRYVFQDIVHERLASWIRRVDRALRRNGAWYLVTLRLIHAPYSLTNYAAGATAVHVRTFWWTTQVGLLPGNVVFVLAGAQLPTLRQLAEQDPWHLVNLPLLLALSLTALVPLAFRAAWRRRKNREAGKV